MSVLYKNLQEHNKVGGRFVLLRSLNAARTQWLAMQAELQRHVRLEVSYDEQIIINARKMVQFNHPVLPCVIDMGRASDGYYWIAEEWFDFPSIAQLLRENGEFLWVEAASIIGELIDIAVKAEKLGIEIPFPDVYNVCIEVLSNGRHSVHLQHKQGIVTDFVEDKSPVPQTSPIAVPKASTTIQAIGWLFLDMLTNCSKAHRYDAHLFLEYPDDIAASLRNIIQKTERSEVPIFDTLLNFSGISHPPAPYRRRVAGRYEIINKLNQGGMGMVYRAVDTLTKKVVALKSCVSLNRNEVEGEAISREFKLLASLQHPNLMRVFDYGYDQNDGPFLITELYEGAQDIGTASRGLIIQERLQLLIQIIEGVDYLHKQSILHRDLKPSNIVVAHDRVRILDFGISVELDQLSVQRVAGTPGYLAPEILKGKGASIASDIWAIGVIAHEMLTGRHPFQGGLTPYAEIEIPEELRHILLSLLASIPQERSQKLGDVVTTIRSMIGVMDYQARGLTTRFVGRKKELFVIEESIHALKGGIGGSIVLVGPTGIGKTRLLEEIRRHALLEGVGVVRLEAVSEQHDALSMWHPLLRWLALHAQPNELESAVLIEIDEELQSILGQSDLSNIVLSASEIADRLVETLSGLLRKVSYPLVVSMDDIHWLSQYDQLLLKAFTTYRSQVLFILAGREVKLEISAKETLMIGLLSENEAWELAQRVRPNSDPMWVSALGGVPLLLIEGLRNLNVLPGLVSEMSPSAKIKTILIPKISSLSISALSAIQMAAVFGRRIDISLVEQALQCNLSEVWKEAWEADILEGNGQSLSFAHESLREMILSSIPQHERLVLEKKAAETLSAHGQVDAARIAWHFQQAGEQKLAAQWSYQAGMQALDHGSLREGLRLLMAAGEPSSLNDQVVYHFRMGEALYALGESERGVACLQKALVACLDPVPPQHHGLVWFVCKEMMVQLWHRLFGVRSSALPVLEIVHEAHILLGIDAYSHNHPMKGLAFTLSSLNRAERMRSWGAITRQWSGFQLVFGSIGFHSLANYFAKLSAHAGAQSGQHIDRTRAYVAAGFYYVGIGEWAVVENLGKEALATFQRVGLIRSRDESLLLLAWNASACGNQTLAREHYEVLAGHAKLRGDHQMQAWAVYGLAFAALEMNHPEEIMVHLKDLDVQQVPDPMTYHALRAIAFIHQGQMREAWDDAIQTDKLIPNVVYSRGVHIMTILILCEVLIELEQYALLPMEKALLQERLKARMVHCERHLKVAPIIEPGWWLLQARRFKESYETYKQKAEQSAKKMQICLSERALNPPIQRLAAAVTLQGQR